MHRFVPLYVKTEQNIIMIKRQSRLIHCVIKILSDIKKNPSISKTKSMLYLKKHHLQSELQGCMKITLNSITIS